MAEVQAGQGSANTPPAQPVQPSVVEMADARSTRRQPAVNRLTYRKGAVAGEGDDHIINSSLHSFYFYMAWAGGIAILVWILLGGFQWGRATAPGQVGVSTNSTSTIRVEVPELGRVVSAIEKVAEKATVSPPQIVKVEVERVVQVPPPPQPENVDEPKEVSRQSVWDEPTVPAPPH